MRLVQWFAQGAIFTFFAGLVYVAHEDPRPLLTWSIETANAAVAPLSSTSFREYRGENPASPEVSPFAAGESPGSAATQTARQPSTISSPRSASDRAGKPQRPTLELYSLTESTPALRKLRRYIAKRYETPEYQLTRWFKAIEVEALRHGFDPLLIVAMIAVESGFDPAAQSEHGALGLMQVVPKWHLDKIDARVAGEPQPDHLFVPEVNIAVGVEVLAEGLRRYGSLEKALLYYHGSVNDPTARYSKRVLALYRQLQQIAGLEGERVALLTPRSGR